MLSTSLSSKPSCRQQMSKRNSKTESAGATCSSSSPDLSVSDGASSWPRTVVCLLVPHSLPRPRLARRLRQLPPSPFVPPPSSSPLTPRRNIPPPTPPPRNSSSSSKLNSYSRTSPPRPTPRAPSSPPRSLTRQARCTPVARTRRSSRSFVSTKWGMRR